MHIFVYANSDRHTCTYNDDNFMEAAAIHNHLKRHGTAVGRAMP